MIALVVLSILLVLAASVAVTALVVSPRLPPGPSSFPCKLRPAGPGNAMRRWPRRTCRAIWVHDVLLVRRGRLLVRLDALPVLTPQASPRVDDDDPRGLGFRPVTVVLELDDGALLELAAPRWALGYVVGPFLAAAVAAFPKGPRGPRDNRNIER